MRRRRILVGGPFFSTETVLKKHTQRWIYIHVHTSSKVHRQTYAEVGRSTAGIRVIVQRELAKTDKQLDTDRHTNRQACVECRHSKQEQSTEKQTCHTDRRAETERGDVQTDKGHTDKQTDIETDAQTYRSRL